MMDKTFKNGFLILDFWPPRMVLALGWIGISFGWFNGNAPALLSVQLLELQENYPKGYSSVTVFHVQVLKFIAAISIYWER